MRRSARRRPLALGAFAFLTSGFALAQAPTPPPPAPTPPAAAPAPPQAAPPATPPSPQTPAAPPSAPAPGTDPAAPAAPPPPAPAEASKSETPAPAAIDAPPAEPPPQPLPEVPAGDKAQAEAQPKLPKVQRDELDRPGTCPAIAATPGSACRRTCRIRRPPSATRPRRTARRAPPTFWNFNFSGFFAAGVRAVIRERPLPPGSDRTLVALRNAVSSGEPFSAGGTQGSWVQMTFEYGNRIATAHATLTTWNPSRGASFTQLGSQNFVDSAYMTFRIPPIAKLRIGMAIGAFGQTYGNLGQYGGGFYSNSTGSIRGMGETVSAEYDLTDTIVLTADHGIMASSDKAPGGCDRPHPRRADSLSPARRGPPWPRRISATRTTRRPGFSISTWASSETATSHCRDSSTTSRTGARTTAASCR